MDINYTPPPDNNSNTIFFDANKVPEFLNNIDRKSIIQLSTNFDNIPIKQVTDSIKQILINSANKTFQKYQPKSNNVGIYPCYTNKARKLTRKYRRVRNLNKRNKVDEHAEGHK